MDTSNYDFAMAVRTPALGTDLIRQRTVWLRAYRLTRV